MEVNLNTMLEAIRIAFLKRDRDGFMKNFDIDIVSKFYVEKLFEKFTFYRVVQCSYKISEVDISKEMKCRVEYFLSYENDKKEILQFQMEIEETENSGCIIAEVKILNIYKAFNLEKERLSTKQIQELLAYEQADIPFEDMIKLAKESRDPLSPKTYERALNKSIRYRLTHPEIENAIILSVIMSKRGIALAKKIKDKDKLKELKKLNTFLDNVFVHKTYKEIRNKDKSTFPARELSLESVVANIDELLFQYETQDGKRVDIKCSEIAPLYAAIFRLTGFPIEKSIMLLLPFHYMNYIEIDDKFYIVDVNHIVEMDPERIYGGYDTLSGCVTVEYYIDQFGNTNMPKEIYDSVLYKMQKQLPTMQLLPQPQIKNVFPAEGVTDFEQYLELNDLLEIQCCIIKKTFELSSEYPFSAYTWAKYCYRTIFVTYPQTYICYSLARKECIEFSELIKTKEELFVWMQGSLKQQSIYSGKDQIMTADQVLQYQCGGSFDRAVFIYTILKLSKVIEEGNIIFTYSNAYVRFRMDKSSYLYDAASLNQVSCIEKRILLQFNELEAFSEWS